MLVFISFMPELSNVFFDLDKLTWMLVFIYLCHLNAILIIFVQFIPVYFIPVYLFQCLLFYFTLRPPPPPSVYELLFIPE
jgi:hypothetical protein